MAEDLYIYGYPLVLSEMVRRKYTAVSRPSSHGAPVNQFAHRRFPAAPSEKDDHHPHADCLRSSAWLDLRREPVVLSVPRIGSFYLMSLFSGWYEIFASVGTRTRGDSAADYLIVGPRTSDRAPEVFEAILAPTDMVWIDGYFEVGAAEDIGQIHVLQDQFRLTPLSQWASPAVRRSGPFPADEFSTMSPQEKVALLDGSRFYSLLARLLERNPPQDDDAGLIAEASRIGFVPGAKFEFEKLSSSVAVSMNNAVFAAQQEIVAAESTITPAFNNWWVHTHPGRFHTRYLKRAAAALSGTGGALVQDVMCFHAEVDFEGDVLRGTNRYVLAFAKNAIPPVDCFWSLTLYNSQNALVQNYIHRYTIQDRDHLRYEPDGSLVLHIQHDWPGETRDTNWLPAPKDTFSLVFCLYAPKPDAIEGRWQVPAVMRIDS